jgi:monovalent cation/proton antiporter MnhG/PhaG subunit
MAVTVHDVAVGVLLVIGVAAEVVCCVGVLVMDDVFDRIHYAGASTTVGPLAIAAAMVVQETLSTAGIKAILVALTLLITNPVVSQATARAARVRQFGHWVVLDDELAEDLP